ncbi:MAG: DUF47 family protein [Desulfurococcaceae archaeon]
MRLPGGKILEDVVDKVSEHVNIITDGVKLLRDIVMKFYELNNEDLENMYVNLSGLENRGDDLKIQIMNMLRVSHIHPEDREDLLRLVLDIDEIIGISRAIAKKFLIFKHIGISIPESIYEHIKEMTENSIRAVEQIYRMIEAREHEVIFEVASKVEQLEKRVDELRLQALESMYKQCLNEYRVICVALPIVIDDLEVITDLCEDIADIYRLYAISR